MNVIFTPEVQDYLDNLIPVLYEKEYFGFEDAAVDYVNDLIDDIYSGISHKQAKFAPAYFSKYGKNMYYVSYKRNKNTTWYIFFNHADDIYYIRYIGNNHSIGQYL